MKVNNGIYAYISRGGICKLRQQPLSQILQNACICICIDTTFPYLQFPTKVTRRCHCICLLCKPVLFSPQCLLLPSLLILFHSPPSPDKNLCSLPPEPILPSILRLLPILSFLGTLVKVFISEKKTVLDVAFQIWECLVLLHTTRINAGKKNLFASLYRTRFF